MRTESSYLARLATETHERSATFRGLVAALQASDVVVYLEFGQCSKRARACLQFLTRTDSHRYLLVRIDQFGSSVDEHAGLVGHELQHAVDVSRTAAVVDRASFGRFFSEVTKPAQRDSETEALRIERAVTRESVRTSPPRQG